MTRTVSGHSADSNRSGVLLVCLTLMLAGAGPGCAQPAVLSLAPAGTLEVFVSPDVNCHQGYTTDGTYHYTIDTQRIDKRLDDANWTCIASNTAPLQGLTNVYHLGDGKYYNGKLYIVAEWWNGCGNFTNQSILVFDAATLARLEFHDVSAQGHEVSGLVVVPTDGSNGVIYVTSYCDGTKLFMYDLVTYGFLGTLPLSLQLPSLQGITYHQGLFYVACDWDAVYSITPSGDVTLVYQSHIPGSHEGLDYSQTELRWLIDGGTGSKFVHYISISGLALSWPATVTGAILQATTNPADPTSWAPVAAPKALSASTNKFIIYPTDSRFFRLQQN